MRAALGDYELRPDFTALAASTKYEYRLILKEFGQDLGDLTLTVFTPAYVKALRDAWAARGHRAVQGRGDPPGRPGRLGGAGQRLSHADAVHGGP